MKYERDYANCKNEAVNDDRREIEFKLVRDCFVSLKPAELLELATRNRRGRSRISSRTISSSDDIALFEVEAANLALMNTSAVISTWRGCGKGLNLSLGSQAIVGNDAHRVSSFNVLDILPTNSMPGERIDYLNTFIKEDNYWMDKELIGNRASKKTPNRCNSAARGSIVKKVHISESAKEEKAHIAEDIGTPGAKELGIRHLVIFSRAKISRAVEMRAA